jgi:hypothetical protein
MKRRDFVRNTAIAGVAAAAAPIAKSLAIDGFTPPAVHLTQRDFVSTFPWGLRGDRVRILQQEVEDEILDAETLSAMAVMLGAGSSSAQLDDAWKLLLDSQNHDVHVCLYDEEGIDWCKQAREIAARVKQTATEFIAGKVGGEAIAINTLSWARPLGAGGADVPGIGYAVTTGSGSGASTASDEGVPWTATFKAQSYSIRLLEDGCLELLMGSNSKPTARLGHLTLYSKGVMCDSRSSKPEKIEARLTKDGRQAFARVQGKIDQIPFTNTIRAAGEFIEMETELDYGDGRFFGPEVADIEREPRRVHYFQHDRKLCMNWQLPGATATPLYTTPFLSWPADHSRSIESSRYMALEAPGYGIAHFNVGQAGYGFLESESACRHVLAYAPQKYVYGKAEKLVLKGRHTHRYRFMPYRGDWRGARLPLRASEYGRPLVTIRGGGRRTRLPECAALLGLDSNSTIATALFERSGRIYVRLWEWAGQADSVTLKFGGGAASARECTHGLRPLAPLKSAFPMRPWEIKTIELTGRAEPLPPSTVCSRASRFARQPEGWGGKSYFETVSGRKAAPVTGASEKILYFASGYHDGFVRPMQKHVLTMDIEMQRIRSGKYPNYGSCWEIGGSSWAAMSRNEPEYLESLKPFLKEGSIEIVGATWSEPLAQLLSGESTMRQLFYGLESIEKHLNTEVRVHSNQEHGTFAQMPQILSSFGLKAVVNRSQWAPFGYESGFDAEVAEWIGVDGSRILLIPRYNSMDYLSATKGDPKYQNGSITGHNRVWRTREKFLQMRDEAIARGIDKPLMTMLEDIWAVAWRSTDQEMDFYASLPFVKFVTISRYLAMLGL